MATLMEPVSSETMTTTASEFSLMPMPARWRMPRSRERFTFLLRGSMQPAPSSRPWRMMTAPSCMGAFTKKMFFRSSLETAASSTVPLRTMSSSCIFCSKTMRAPVRLRDISVQASTVWAMVFSISVTVSSREKMLRNFSRWLPTCSRTRRISGWKRMMRASTPHSSIRLRMKLMPLRCRMEERNSTARKISTPFRRFVPLVVFSRVRSL